MYSILTRLTLSSILVGSVVVSAHAQGTQYTAERALGRLVAFVLVDDDAGFLTYSTDFAVSTHLKRFTLSGGADSGPDLFSSVGDFAPVLVYDPNTRLLFLPDGAPGQTGVRVFKRDGTQLTTTPTATSGPPTDLLLLPASSAVIGGDR